MKATFNLAAKFQNALWGIHVLSVYMFFTDIYFNNYTSQK